MPERDNARVLGALLVVLAALGGGRAAADDPLPAHAVARLGSYQFYHGPGVSATFSPDGARIASVAREPYSDVTETEREKTERVVVLWDAATGDRVRELQVPHAPAGKPHFSPDGKQLAASYGREDGKAGVAVFDVASGKLATDLGNLSRSPNLVGFSADGKSLLFHEGPRGPLVRRDIKGTKATQKWDRLEGPSEWVKGREYVWRMVPSADATFIASLIDDPPDYSKLKGSPKEWVYLPPHVPRPTVLVMSDGPTGKPLYRKAFPDEFTFSADGRRFATCGAKVTFYETATGKELFALDAKSPYALDLSPDGRWAVMHSGASQVRLWNLETKKPSHELFSGLTYIRARADFSADGKSVVLTTDSTVRLFDTATGKEQLSPGHRAGVIPRFSADGKTLFTTCDELRRSWDVSALKKPALLTSESRKTWEGICGQQVAAQSPDGRLFVDEVDHRLRIRDTRTGRVQHRLEDDGWSGTFGVFSPDGLRVALRRYRFKHWPDGGVSLSDEPEMLRLYDTATGKKTGEVALKNGLSWVVPAFSADGKTLAWADRTADVHLHDAVTGKLVRTLHSAEKLCDGECHHAVVLFSPDSKHLFAFSDQHEVLKRPKDKEWVTLPARVFEIATGKEVSRFYTNPKTTTKSLSPSCVAASSDGRLLAVAEKESGAIRLFDPLGGKSSGKFVGHRDGVRGLAFSPDGKTLASGGQDGVAFLWDVTGFGPKKGLGKKD